MDLGRSSRKGIDVEGPRTLSRQEQSAGATTARVIIVQRRMTHYRLPLFERLRNLLAENSIPLQVLVGEAHEAELSKNDGGCLPWAIDLPTRYFLGGRLCWQPFGQYLRRGDLVIVAQENRLLYNLWLLRPWRAYAVAFWGHGRNFQSKGGSHWRERFKRWITNKVDWWFCYTELSRDAVLAAGFAADRITVLNNSIDTAELEQLRRDVSSDQVERLRRSLGLGRGPVGVFLGSLTAEKRLPFLFEACLRIRETITDFQLVVIGDGPLRPEVSSFAALHPDWVRYVGGRQGRDKVLHALLGDVLLMPGMVGLVVLDAFVLGLPIITTDCGIHSPEIAYLEHGVNGLVAEDEPAGFAQAVGDVVMDRARLESLKAAALLSAGRYSVQAMADRFATGIMTARACCADEPRTLRGRGR